MARRSAQPRQRGFTLIEMILVIVITGVIAGVVAVFIQKPIVGYFDASRRAALSDTADTALRRIGRDIRLALPNSVRVKSSGGVQYLEFIPTLAGGRYQDAAAANCFTTGCGSVTTFGSLIAADNEYAGKSLVIFNYYNNAGGDCGVTLPSAYCGQNLASIAASTDSGGQDVFTFAAAKRFYPAGGSPGRHFQIAGAPVSYVCDASGGLLTRYEGYAMQAVQPTGFAGASNALLAKNVSACAFQYEAGAWQRFGLATLHLTLTAEGESVTLYHEVHVDNSP